MTTQPTADRCTAAAVICEYDPFHNGHRFHLDKTKELFGAHTIVAIMSGDFTQRGGCALFSKQTRARAALMGGADLVVELPLPYCISSAERFAMGGVSIADALGCVDMLSFGCECGNVGAITDIARLINSSKYTDSLGTDIPRNQSFAAARSQYIEQLHPGSAQILGSPNNTLAVEYCKALLRLSSDIRPVAVRREAVEHNGAAPSGDIASASYIRSLFDEGTPALDALNAAADYIPPPVYDVLRSAAAAGEGAMLLSRLDRAILLKLRSMTREQLRELPDVSEGLEHRIYDCAGRAASVVQLCDMIKSKRYTHSRIRRIVMYAFLGVTADMVDAPVPYIRVLGMNSRGRELLRIARPSLPIITRHADLKRLDEAAMRVFRLGEYAADVLSLCAPAVLERGRDATQGIVIVQ